MIDVVAFGEMMMRLSTGQGTTIASASGFDINVAGSEGNVAVALAALGHRTEWVGAVPDDPLGRRVIATMRGAGVGVSGVRVVKAARLGTFFVELAVPPRPTRVVYDRAGSAFAELEEPPLPSEAASWVITSGITAAVLRDAPHVMKAFLRSSMSGARLLVDVNHRTSLWSPAQARTGLRALLSRASVVVCSARDLRAVFDLSADLAAAGDMLDAWAPSADLLVVTRGSEGATAYLRDGTERHEAAVPVEVGIDSLGAGDAFVAGLLHGLLADDLDLGLRAGVLLGAIARTVAGDHVQVSRGQLDEMLAPGDRQVLR